MMEGNQRDISRRAKVRPAPVLRLLPPLLILLLLLSAAPEVLALDLGLKAVIHGPATASRGQTLTFDGSYSEGAVAEYRWDFHDGSRDEGSLVTHAFVEEGRYTVALSITGFSGHQDLAALVVEVRNQPPTARFESTDEAAEDESVAFDATASTDPDDSGDVLTYRWAFGDGATAEGRIVRHAFPAQGGFEVRLLVEDPHGVMGHEERAITIHNIAPRARIAGPLVLSEGELGLFDASASWDTPSDVGDLLFSWDFGDGTRGADQRVRHSFLHPGQYGVTVTVVDPGGLRDTASRTVTVVNLAPQVRIDSVPEAEEGSAFTVRAVARDTPNDGPRLIYQWSTGSGGPRIVLTPWDEGSLPLTVEVQDEEGASARASAVVQVRNVNPMAAITNIYATASFTFAVAGPGGTPTRIDILRSDVLVASASLLRKSGPPFDQAVTLGPLDLRLDDDWTAVILFGSDSLPPDGAAASVFLTITFDDGTTEELHHVLLRAKASSWVWVVNLNALMLGHPLHVRGQAFDPGSDDLTLSWTLPDGSSASSIVRASPAQSTFALDTRTLILPSSRPRGDKDYEVVLMVKDADGGSGSALASLTLRGGVLRAGNLAPTAMLGPLPATVREEEGVVFKASAFDGLADSSKLQFHWDFGDGGTSSGPVVNHAFLDSGSYQVKLTTTDGSASSIMAALINVQNRPPSFRPMEAMQVAEDQSVVFSAPIEDTPSDLQGMRALWDFGDGGWAVGMMVDHSYARSGRYEGVLYAVDDDGAGIRAPFAVTVVNLPPGVGPRLSPRQSEGQAVLLEAEATEGSSDLPLVQFFWSIGDLSLTGRRVALTMPAGTILVNVSVVDDDAAQGSALFSIVVEPLIPLLHLPDLALRGDGILRETGLTFGGPLPQNSLLRWNFGDGESSFAPFHTYSRDGVYDLAAQVLVAPQVSGPSQAQASIVVHLDSDGDGIGDQWEREVGGNAFDPDSDDDGQLDSTELARSPSTLLNSADTDGDGLWDGYNITGIGVFGELGVGTDPLNPDTDGDGLRDGAEVLGWQVHALRDGQGMEFTVGSNPLLNDTDFDGIPDLQERNLGLDPRDPDTDHDGLDDLEEITRGDDGAITSPVTPDTDFDGVWDYFDRRPDGISSISWNERYPPGLIRFDQEYSVYSVHGVSAYTYKYNIIDGCQFVGDHTSDSTKSSIVWEGAVRDQIFSDLVKGGQVNYTPYRAAQLQGVSSSYYSYSAGACDLLHPNKYDLTYEIRRERYSVNFINGEETTAHDEDGNPQLYALEDMEVELGKDQSVIIQFSLPPQKDRTTNAGTSELTVPAFAYSLYTDRHFGAHGPLYSNLAVAAPLSDHAYEAEIRLLAEPLTIDTTAATESGTAVTLMILPVWITSSDNGLSRRALDPTTMTVASITRETSVNATEVIANLGTNLTDLRKYLPVDLARYTTGYYDFGPYLVYIFNSPRDSFEEASLDSTDAVVLVETSQARLVSLRESIVWEKHQGWVENYNDAFNMGTRLFNFLLRAAKMTIRLVDLHDLRTYQALGLSQVTLANKGRDTIVVEKISANGEVRYLVSRVDKGYSTVWTVHSSSGVVTAEVFVWTSSREEILSDVDNSKILTQRYGGFKNGVRAGQIGLIAVTQGREAVISYRDGNAIRGTVYASATAAGILGVSKPDVLLRDLGIKGKLGLVRFGTVAAMAASALLTSYEVYQGVSTSNPISKRSHFESASATAIDSAITFLIPGYGAAAQFGWLGGNLLISYVMPNELAAKITSSPGSTITFLFEYFFTGDIPSTIAEGGLGGALTATIQFAETENEAGSNVVVITPG